MLAIERAMGFFELFAQSVREVLPLARRKKLTAHFDCHGPELDVALAGLCVRAGIHRVFLGLIDCVDSGSILFSAESAPPVSGLSTVLIHAAATDLRSPACLSETIGRLKLAPWPARGRGNGSKAVGVCPATGGRVELMDAGPAGVVISLALSVAAMEVPQAHPPPDAAGTAAWLVSPIPGALDCLHRRLGHLGWRVSVFASVEHAMALMATRLKNIQEPPGLLIVEESNGTELPRMERIAAALPQVWPVLAVVTGSATVLLRGDTLVDIRCLPFSPRELERFTTHVDCRTSTVETRETSPTPLYAQDSGLVLVVDDDPINQAVVRGQLEVLGYDVVVAGDGAQALDACLRHPPDMVLMDVDMPVMDGLQATERVRAMQQAGMLPPFPIVAATGENSESRRKTCFCAGMDGYLSKPIDLRILAKEIHRVLPTRPVLTTGPGYA